MNTLELLPCPHCGKGAPTVRVVSSLEDEDDEDRHDHTETWTVTCDASTASALGGCGSGGGYRLTAEAAVALWNDRTAITPPKREERLPADILAMCKLRGWNMHWTHRGAYLHLESSELIEALRGKRGDPLHEAADVLLVLMSITENAGLQWSAVTQQARATCEALKTRPRYAGEEYEAHRYTTPK